MRAFPVVLASVVAAAVGAAAVVAHLLAAEPLAAPNRVPTASPVLVELFTSEGCSSCPPADALLRTLSGAVSAGGHPVITVGEHVTYWNYLGWTDRFSAEAYTQRQNAYAEHFGLDSVYTPQAVVNGRHQLVGNDRDGLLQAIDSEPARQPVGVRITAAQVGDGRVKVAYTADANAPSGAQVLAVLVDDMDSTEVRRGENGGRTLQHASVARAMSMGPLNGSIDVAFPHEAQQDRTHARHVVVFVQAAGPGAVLGVDTRAL